MSSASSSKKSKKTKKYVSWGEVLFSRYFLTILLFCMAIWLHAVDTLVVATMLPSLISDLGGVRYVSWSVGMYEIGTIVSGVSSALLLGRFGFRNLMTFCGLLFSFGCFLSMFAPSMFMFLLGRLLQGLGGGGLIALVFVSVGSVFPRRIMARVMALISLFWGGASFLGPLIGGLFVTYSTWRYGFLFLGIQALLVTFFIYLGTSGLMEDYADSELSLSPLLRLFVLIGSVYSVAVSGVYDDVYVSLLWLFFAILLFAIFLRLDSGSSHLLPYGCFDFRTPQGSALLLIFFISFGSIALWTYGAILLVSLHNVSILTAGYILTCLVIGWSFFALLVSGYPESLDRHFIMLGISLTSLSVVGLYYVVSDGPILLIAFFGFLQSGGLGMSWTFIRRRLDVLVIASEQSRVSAALPTIQRLGFAVGSVSVGIVANWTGFPFASTRADYALVSDSIFLFSFPFVFLAMVCAAKFCYGRFGDESLTD